MSSQAASPHEPSAPAGGSLFLVDGYNFLHAVVLRGRERAHFWSVDNQARVVALVSRSLEGEVWVVFDAAPHNAERLSDAEGAVRCLYAPDADARILELVGQYAPARRVVVVSADRSLCDRAKNLGGERRSPWDFAASCDDH
jgi:predicted RNA-binding protein with PIN domain